NLRPLGGVCVNLLPTTDPAGGDRLRKLKHRGVGMRVERSITIARPPAEVFGYIADIRNDPSWHTDVLEVSSSTDAVGMGTAVHVKVEPSMGVSEVTMTVTRLEQGTLIEFDGRMGEMAPRVTNICEPEGQGTRVTRRVEIDPPGIMRLMSPLIASKIGKDN